MITCPKCGAILPEGSKFCQKCGTKLTQQSNPSDQKNNQPKGYTESTSKDSIKPKPKESEVKSEKKESNEPLKPENKSVSSGQSINTHSGESDKDMNNSEKTDVHSGEPLETDKSMNDTGAKGAVSEDKSKVSSTQIENEPSPMVTGKSNMSAARESNKEVSPANLSPLGKRLYELKMLNEHKIITDEEYGQRKKKVLEEYVNS